MAGELKLLCTVCGERQPARVPDQSWLLHPEAPKPPVCKTCLMRERRRFVIEYKLLGLSPTEIAHRMGVEYKMVKRDLDACIKLADDVKIPDNADALREFSRLRYETIIRRAFGIVNNSKATHTARIRALAEIRKTNARLDVLLDLGIQRPPEREEEPVTVKPATRSTGDSIRRRLKIS